MTGSLLIKGGDILLSEKPKLAISFSGGRTSAVMAKLCLEKYGRTHDIRVTFANTGAEHPATYEFINECDLNWFTPLGHPVVWLEAVVNPKHNEGIRHKIVTYETSSRHGEPFEAFVAKYGVPNRTTPQCTSRLKTDVMENYLKSQGFLRGKKLNYTTAIGLRADEIGRMSSVQERERLFYPLIDIWPMTKADVNRYMAQFPWDLKLPSDAYGNCVFCWKKTLRKLCTVATENPKFFEIPDRLESRYGHVKPGAASGPDGKRTFFKGYRSAKDIIALAQEGRFTHFEDPEWDLASDCSESCEVYADIAAPEKFLPSPVS